MYASASWASIGSDNALSLVRREAIAGSNAVLLSIEPPGTNFNENWIQNTKRFIYKNALENIVCEMAVIFRYFRSGLICPTYPTNMLMVRNLWCYVAFYGRISPI